MFLKRLELQGFKSFADKIILEFPQGIVAIVGPNGSGKSNVTDGIRWLLGEREARNLRGAKVEDLIFAGTEKRARAGLAQAALCFDNSSGFFPVDFKEISISRRISRDGNSQFYLNKSEVRLKDVIDFFARSRLGARGLTVVSQGESDVFIKAMPLERRALIEEILGLKEYQMKKSEARRRLEGTSVNLEKAKALIEELKPRLRLLQRQVARYEGRAEIARELKELEDAFYGNRIKALNQELSAVTPQLTEVNSTIKEREKKLHDDAEELEKIKNTEPEAKAVSKEVQEKKRELLERRAILQREIGRVEVQIEIYASAQTDVSKTDLVKTLRRVKDIAYSLRDQTVVQVLKEGIREIAMVIEQLSEEGGSEQANKLKQVNGKLLEELRELDRAVEELEKAERKRATQLEDFNKDFRKSFMTFEAAKDALQRLVDERNRLLFQKERVELKLRDLRQQLGEIGRQIDEFTNWKGEVINQDDEAVMRKMFKLRGELAAIGEIDKTLLHEAREAGERHAFLTEQVTDLDKAVLDLHALIKELEYKIHHEFDGAVKTINEEFTNFIRAMFGGGRAKLVLQKRQSLKEEGNENSNDGDTSQEEIDTNAGVEIDIVLPKKRVKGLEVLSGGERSLVSIAALFALISVSPPPFLVLDEIDAALDERNARRFSEILKGFSKKTQFIIITHNRATMEAADVLYGVTMSPDGTSKILSLKLTS